MRTDVFEAIGAASEARYRAAAQLDAAERAARAYPGPETITALLEALRAQADVTDALMKVCTTLAQQISAAPRGEAGPLALRLN